MKFLSTNLLKSNIPLIINFFLKQITTDSETKKKKKVRNCFNNMDKPWIWKAISPFPTPFLSLHVEWKRNKKEMEIVMWVEQ